MLANIDPRASSNFVRTARWAVCALLLLGSVTAGAQIPVPDILWYRFNESGTTVTNHASSPPAGTATANLGASFSQSNPFSATASSLAGTGAANDFVNTGWATNLTGSWTMSFFTSNIVPSATLWYIIGDDATTFRVFTNGVAGANNWILRGTGITDVYVNGAADAGQHMVTFVYDSTVSEIRAYKDAVLVSTVAQGAITVVSAGPFKVGNWSTRAGLNGKMADFRLYSSALTQTDISNINDLILHSYYIGGAVSGLSGSGLALQNNAGDDLPIAADGSFQFATPLLDGTGYDVTVSAQPPGQNCTVSNGSGNVASANVTDVSVSCVDTATDLVITVDDGLGYVQYGQPVDYIVTLTNNGGTTANGVTVASAVTGLRSQSAQWSCTPAGGATCTATGSGPFGDTVTVPFNGTLNWIVTMPVLNGDTVEFDVNAPGTSASDVDTVVIFRDGFGD
jgi:hypothetical protein